MSQGRAGYTCNVCRKLFSKREHLIRHCRVHTREKPFACTECGKAFARLDTLQRHMRSHHPEVTNFVHGSPSTEQTSPAASSTHQSYVESRPATYPHRPHTDLEPIPAWPGSSNILSPSTAHSASTAVDVSQDITHPATLFSPDLDLSWLLTNDFQIDENFHIEEMGTKLVNDATPSHPWVPFTSSSHMSSTDAAVGAPSQDSTTQRSLADVSGFWFNSVDLASRGTFPSLGEGSSELSIVTGDSNFDELHRARMKSSLRPQLPDNTLPSNDFLNRCIHLFFTKFWPIFPLIHLPTFKPSQTNPLLLLSICSVGAAIIGTSEAIRQGIRLYENVNKAILVSWDSSKIAGAEGIAIIQASVIGQNFALLSSQSSHIVMAHSLHGTLAVGARSLWRRFTLSRDANSRSSPPADSEANLDKAWKDWIIQESYRRSMIMLQIHDAELASMLHHAPLLRTNPSKVQPIASDAMFNARSATGWQEMSASSGLSQDQAFDDYSSSSRSTQRSIAPLERYATLEAILAQICERNEEYFDLSQPDTSASEGTLCTWFIDNFDLLRDPSLERLSLGLLWHSVFMSLSSNINLLEQACGRDGISNANACINQATDWAASPLAKRAVVHAFCVVRALGDMRMRDVPALHVARSAFQAGVILTSYSKFGQDGYSGSITNVGMMHYPEMLLLTQKGMLSDYDWSQLEVDYTAQKCKSHAYNVTTILRRLGYWGISRNYAHTLDAIIQDNSIFS